MFIDEQKPTGNTDEINDPTYEAHANISLKRTDHQSAMSAMNK